jgi:methanogenic corrinoid protein MtbC1
MRGEARSRESKPPDPERDRDLTALQHAINQEVIPRLVRRHREGGGAAAKVAPARDQPTDDAALVRRAIEPYLAHVAAGRLAEMDAVVAQLRQAGCTVERVYLELLKPVAHRLGEMWCDDDMDFAQVTLATGRLQRVLRDLSPAFAAEVEAAAHAHRALFVQAEGEQHGFGLSMLAEFFRRAGWDVLGGVGTAAVDPVERVRREWVDLVGLSVGSLPRLPAVKQVVARLRAASRNPALVVMVGGPLFHQHPEVLGELDADGHAADARAALQLAEALVRERQAGGQTAGQTGAPAA